jgi:Tol biopolymer transport system component
MEIFSAKSRLRRNTGVGMGFIIGLPFITLLTNATDRTTRASISATGTEVTGDSRFPSLSGDGRYVAFESQASDMVADDTNGMEDIFVRDRTAGTTERVSVAGNGREANNGSFEPSISADGRYVAFYSYASNLVPDDTNGAFDVFVHDRHTGRTERVSVASSGRQAMGARGRPSIGADGRYVAFQSSASDLVTAATNKWEDVFVRDRTTGTTELVSVASGGRPGSRASRWPSISADGRYVTFTSEATNLVPEDRDRIPDVFVRDRTTGSTELVSMASYGTQGGSDLSNSTNGPDSDLYLFGFPSISADGRYVAFHAAASDLVAIDTNGEQDVFVRDHITGTITRVSISGDGTEADGPSSAPSISYDGRYVAFGSLGSNLVSDDTNGKTDVFVYDLAVRAINDQARGGRSVLGVGVGVLVIALLLVSVLLIRRRR